MIPSTGAV